MILVQEPLLNQNNDLVCVRFTYMTIFPLRGRCFDSAWVALWILVAMIASSNLGSDLGHFASIEKLT